MKGRDGEKPYLPCRALATVFGAARGVAGDAESVARWGYELYGARIVKPESVAQMTDFADGDAHGLGTWDLDAVQRGRWGAVGIGHIGGTLGYRTVLAVFPASKVAVALLTPSVVDILPYVPELTTAGSLLTR